MALLVFHVLFLKTPPHGILLPLGCLAIALTFAACGFSRCYPLRAFFTSAVVFAAILTTWWLHTRYASVPEEYTPLFRYDYTWTQIQVAWTALSVALPIGILGNLINLRLTPQKDD
jgi:hypothetical protein